MPAATDQQPRPQNTAALERLLAQSGLTQREFAERVGINQSNLSRIVNGRSNARLVTLKAIALSFGIPVSELLSTPGSEAA